MSKSEMKMLLRCIKALCPNCTARHVLDNGCVWIFCGARRLIDVEDTPENAIHESDIIEAIRVREKKPIYWKGER